VSRRAHLTIAGFLLLISSPGGCSGSEPARVEGRHREPRGGHRPAGQHGGHHHGTHHTAHHRFRDAERWAKRFESPKRARWQKPEQVIRRLQLPDDARVADVGAGTGYFAARFARALPRGKVYAIDVEPDMVRYLARRAKREQLANLVPLRGAAADPKIPQPVDLVFICNTYHHIADRPRYMRGLRRSLRPGGRIAIVDYKRGELPVGPPERHRVFPAQLHRELVAAGYWRVLLDQQLLPYQYLAVYVAASRSR